jgi:hypothetical protein
MKCRLATGIFFSILFCSIQAKNYHSYKDVVLLINDFESSNSFISYVTIDGLPYIVKQKKDPGKQISVVRDAFAAWIAKDLKIAHSVTIIPANQEFYGKKNRDNAAVLLTIAPGKTLKNQPESKYYKLSLKQRLPDTMLSAHRWLTETIIYQMTWHPQLPVIIGLDIFLCNTDRHKSNLFYDNVTDTFCAIDMDNIFRRNLPELALGKLKRMVEYNKQFTPEEIKALTIMRDTITFLMGKYSVKKLTHKLDTFVQQAAFAHNGPVSRLKIVKKVAHHKRIIAESRVSAQALALLLTKIINQSSKA